MEPIHLKIIQPVARRVLGESIALTLMLRLDYARALYLDPTAMLNDAREAVETLEDARRIVWRVLGCAHPLAAGIEYDLQVSQEALRAREETPKVA
jgi:hypothetical protein